MNTKITGIIVEMCVKSTGKIFTTTLFETPFGVRVQRPDGQLTPPTHNEYPLYIHIKSPSGEHSLHPIETEAPHLLRYFTASE